MSRKNTCVLIYSNYQDARQAVTILQAQNFNMNTVSIIGKAGANQSSEFAGQLQFHNYPQRLSKNLWAIPGGILFFKAEYSEALIAAGAIVKLLVLENQTIDINEGFTALATALFNMGIPLESIKQYENAVISDNVLLTVNGSIDAVELACRILHNKIQQMTVHIA